MWSSNGYLKACYSQVADCQMIQFGTSNTQVQHHLVVRVLKREIFFPLWSTLKLNAWCAKLLGAVFDIDWNPETPFVSCVLFVQVSFDCRQHGGYVLLIHGNDHEIPQTVLRIL
jgi:hypothetical protein